MSRPAFPSLNDNIYRYITAFNWTGLEAGCPVYGRLLATAELNDAIAIELSVHPRGLFVRNVCIAKTQIIHFSLLVVGNGRIHQANNEKPLQNMKLPPIKVDSNWEPVQLTAPAQKIGSLGLAIPQTFGL